MTDEERARDHLALAKLWSEHHTKLLTTLPHTSEIDLSAKTAREMALFYKSMWELYSAI